MNMKGGAYITNTDFDSKAAWLHGFDEAPMIGFHSLEDIFTSPKFLMRKVIPTL